MKNEENFERNYEPTPPKKKSKLWIIIVIICVLVLGIGTLIAYLLTDGFDFSGSSSRSDEESTENKKDNDKENDKDDEKEDEEEKKEDTDKDKDDEKDDDEEKIEQKISIREVIEDKNGNIVVRYNEENDPSYKTNIYDENLKLISEIKDYSKYNWTDGYTLVEDSFSTDSYVLNYKGEKVWEDNDAAYEDVELVSNGHLILVRQVDTFNSSETQVGIYDLNTKKMVLDFTPKYKEYNFGTAGDDTVYLKYDNTFFNTKTNQLITFDEKCDSNFSDGYSTNIEFDYTTRKLAICSNKGGRKTVDLSVGECLNHKNGICFAHGEDTDNNGKVSWYSYLVDLENAKVKKLGTDYTRKVNKVLFNKKGYALLIFENSGNVQYYTVIDKDGKRMFEPVRVNDAKTKITINENNEIRDNNHFMINNDGKNLVVNYKNEVVAEPENGETFNKLVGNYIVVSKDNELYFKNLKGKRVNIKVEG